MFPAVRGVRSGFDKAAPDATGTVCVPDVQVSGAPVPLTVGNRHTHNTVTLQDLIMEAYSVMDYQIVGMADWVKSPTGRV